MSTGNDWALTGQVHADHTPGNLPLIPGKARGLQRITSSDGFVLSCAVDHITEFRELLDPRSDFAEVVRAKSDLIRAVAPVTTAVLVDALYGVGYLGLTGALPRDVGLVVSLEDGDYSLSSPKWTRYRSGWGPRQAQSSGADAVKLLWWYRPDGDPKLAESQRRLLATLGEECSELGLLLIVEPIWFPRPEEATSSREWRIRRAQGITESAATAESLGADILKVEFPTNLDQPDATEFAEEALARLDASITKPWVVLSAGVAFETFEHQVELACLAGASGYIAGRSLWREAVAARPLDRDAAVATMIRRLQRLNDLTRRHGRPAIRNVALQTALAHLPEAWFAR